MPGVIRSDLHGGLCSRAPQIRLGCLRAPVERPTGGWICTVLPLDGCIPTLGVIDALAFACLPKMKMTRNSNRIPYTLLWPGRRLEVWLSTSLGR